MTPDCSYISSLKFSSHLAIITPSLDTQQFITQAPNMIEHINNPVLECKFYHAAGNYFLHSRFDTHQALQFFERALELSILCRDTNEQCSVLLSIALLKYRTGGYRTAQAHIAKALQLLKLVPNFYLEATALRIEALCSTSLGNFLQAIDSLCRGRNPSWYLRPGWGDS
ncbi:hypothetical protein B0H14DRAFT_977956 [Mycena olivaceomarginata]|nr:hypothetical protein B0H14DRAFT_977956 [Mycena olivaceomarginata]